MTEPTTPEVPTSVHFTAHFRDDEGGHVDAALLTLGDPHRPVILFTFEGGKVADLDIHMDVTGFSPADTADFLEDIVRKMRTTKAERVRQDGTREPVESLEALEQAWNDSKAENG